MKREVCFIFSVFPPISMGGVQRYLLNISKGLKEHGYESRILTRYYPPMPKTDNFPHCRVHRIGLNPIPYSSNRYMSAITATLGNLFTYTVLGYFEGIGIAKQCSIIHSQTAFSSDVVLGARLARATKKKHVVTVHQQFGNKVEDIPLTGNLLDLLRGADYVIVNRTNSYKVLLEHGIDRIAILRNPIPVRDFNRPRKVNRLSQRDNRVRCLFIGRLVERRGPELALRGFEYAIRRGANVELWIVGAGELENSLKTYVKSVELQDRVHFFGNQFDVRKFLWQSDIFLATSQIANSPSLALREAMAAELAVVATDVEETKSVVQHKVTGVLVPPTLQAVGLAIEDLVKDEIKRMKLGVAAADFIKGNFDISIHVNDLMKVYESIL